MDRKNLFPYLYKTSFKFDFSDSLRNKIDNFVEISRKITKENNLETLEKNGGVTTALLNDPYFRGPHTWDEFTPLNMFLQDSVNEVLYEWGIDLHLQKQIEGSWVNVHPPGGYTDEHRHHSVLISCVFYLDVPEGSGDFLVRDPLEIYKLNLPVKNTYWDTELWKSVNVKTNDLLLFPGWLQHKTERNNSNNNRYVITWNINPSYMV